MLSFIRETGLVLLTFVGLVISSRGDSAPTLAPLTNIVLAQNAGSRTVALAGITSGAANQSLSITATSSNPALVPPPVVQYTNGSTGTLVFTPASNKWGVATMNVIVNNGAVTNNLATQTFSVQVNNPPTLNALPTITLNEDAPLQTIQLSGITSGAANEAQPVTVKTTWNGMALLPSVVTSYTNGSSTGTLSFKPAADQSGTSYITVTVDDGQPGNGSFYRRFAVVVNAVNDPPTLSSIGNISLLQNAPAQTVGLSGITSGATNEAQTLTVTATSSDPTLIPNPVVSYASPNKTGSLSFTPAANRSGSATVTVKVNDGGASNNIVSRSFTVTVTGSAPNISNLVETGNDARSVTFGFNTDQSATCAIDYGTTTALGLTSASTVGTTHSITLSNLAPATTYYLRVRATGTGGTAQSDIQSALTEAVRVVQFGAETAALSAPMAMSADSSAQDGKYITSTTAGSGAANFDLHLPRGLNYRAWARVKAPSSGGSFYISKDGGPESLISFPQSSTTNAWRWVLLGSTNASPTNCLVLPIADLALPAVDRRITVQPIRISDGANVANPNEIYYLAETKKIWAQAGIDVVFLPPKIYTNSFYYNLSSGSLPNSLYALRNQSTAGQSSDPDVIDLWFCNLIDSAQNILGFTLQSTYSESLGFTYTQNAVSISNSTFTYNDPTAIAHEIGHALGLDHTTFGATGQTNLMSSTSKPPKGAADIFPDGAKYGQLTPQQIAQARSLTFGYPSSFVKVIPATGGTTDLHQISIRGGAANVGIDQLALVNDPTWQPILPGTQPLLTATPSSSTTIDLAWNLNAGNADSVRVDWSLDGINFSSLGVVSGSSTTLRVTNLSNAQNYSFRIVGYNSVEQTANSNIVVAKPL